MNLFKFAAVWLLVVFVALAFGGIRQQIHEGEAPGVREADQNLAIKAIAVERR